MGLEWIVGRLVFSDDILGCSKWRSFILIYVKLHPWYGRVDGRPSSPGSVVVYDRHLIIMKFGPKNWVNFV